MHAFLAEQGIGLARCTWVGLLALALSACSMVGPDYHAPQPNLPQGWTEARGTLGAADQEQLRTWWRAFDDPMLNRLVEQALDRNQELGVALARLQQTRAQRLQVAAGLGPRVSVGGDGEARRASQRMDGASGGHARSWHAGFDASWELDLFGGTRRAVASADAQVEALSHDRHALEVSLLAELASSYAALRTTQARLHIAREHIGTLREGERLAESALRHGLGSSAELLQARAERASAEAVPPVLEADIARLSHAIGVLAGGFPGDWKKALDQPSTLPAMPALPWALPSEVIGQRPDIQASERRLAAATADIGVAEAARLPRFHIPLGLGTSASVLHALFSSASLAWSAGLQAGQVLYDGGRARAGVAAAQANAEAARLLYERDVHQALRDVEDALVSLNSERQRQTALTQAAQESQSALERASRLYRQGLGSYWLVLTAQRSANQTQDALAESQGEALRGAVALYKALGVGW
jgi:NodT family efflux transporter outer membrane factor (OMF) lipoprotein